MCKIGIVLAMISVTLMPVASAQQPPKPQPRIAMDCLPDPVRHVPYSAEFSMTNTAPGSDGDSVVYHYSETEAFDSHGRFLRTTTAPDPSHKGPDQTTGSECDNTTNTQYRWDSLRKILVVLKMPGMDERHGCWESDVRNYFIDFDKARRLNAETQARSSHQTNQDPDHSNPLIEDLGTMTLQGVEVHGTRTTYPPAITSSDPEPPYLREEHWMSPLLGFFLQQEVDYPQSPKHNSQWTRRVTNLKLGDPDLSRFDPPIGYTIVTGTMREVSCNAQTVQAPRPTPQRRR